MKKDNGSSNLPNATSLIVIVFISLFIYFATFSSVISLLYFLPTHTTDETVKVLKRNSQESKSRPIKGTGSTSYSYSITLQLDDGEQYKAWCPKTTYSATMSAFNALREMTITRSKLFNRPVKLNIRTKSIQKGTILSQLIPSTNNSYKAYSLIAIPFIGVILGAILMWSIVIYLLWKMPKLSKKQSYIHLALYFFAFIGGILLASA